VNKSNNYYWYRDDTSQVRLIVGRLLVPFAVLIVIILYGFQPVLSESNNEIVTDSTDSSSIESELENDSSVSSKGYLSKDTEDSSIRENSVSISENEVSIQTNDSSRATLGRTETNISISISNTTPQPDTTVDNTVQPTLVINGEEVNVPKNGRVSQIIKDDTSTTRLRTDIDGDGSSSIRIDSSSN
jgi:hypothetical protein